MPLSEVVGEEAAPMECERPAGPTPAESKGEANARAMQGSATSSASTSVASTSAAPQSSSASSAGRTLEACRSDEAHSLRKNSDSEFVRATSGEVSDAAELIPDEPPAKHARRPPPDPVPPAAATTPMGNAWQAMFASQGGSMRADIARIELSLDWRFTAGLQATEARLIGKVGEVQAFAKRSAADINSPTERKFEERLAASEPSAAAASQHNGWVQNTIVLGGWPEGHDGAKTVHLTRLAIKASGAHSADTCLGPFIPRGGRS